MLFYIGNVPKHCILLNAPQVSLYHSLVQTSIYISALLGADELILFSYIIKLSPCRLIYYTVTPNSVFVSSHLAQLYVPALGDVITSPVTHQLTVSAEGLVGALGQPQWVTLQRETVAEQPKKKRG
jgi:hypothetical protein